MNPEIVPHNMEKMIACLNEVNAQISDMKELFSVLEKKAKKLSHAVEMVVKKEKKTGAKVKKERKPCGFAFSS